MKKVIVIGDTGFFPDSLVWFKENGCELYFVLLKNRHPWLMETKNILSDLRVKIIPVDKLPKLYKKFDSNTLILSAGGFMGDVPTFKGDKNFWPAQKERFEVFYKTSKYNHDHKCGAKCVLGFNGDTGFATQEKVDFFDKHIQYADVLTFDNNLLKELVFQNSSVARTKETMIAWWETPLKRDVIHQTKKPEHELISMGRCFCAFDKMLRNEFNLPMYWLPRPPMALTLKNLIKRRIKRWFGEKDAYQVAGVARSYGSLQRHRKRFEKFVSQKAFGLSHMHDRFAGGVEKFHANKEYYWSLKGQCEANTAWTQKELYYPFSNNPSKDVCYMMFGIIPLIAHTENEYYKTLIEKKMAILIEKPEDFKKMLKMTDGEIQEYRDNIYANQDIYTFDHVGEMLLSLLQSK